VVVLQWSRRQSPACVRFSWFLSVAEKTEISETTKAFAFWTYLRERSSADRARPNGWFGFHTVNASALFKSEPRVRSMPFSITPVPFEWFPEGACTRPIVV
jgi:hypothetical protein